MNIEGLDYNTQRERLILPEYGREIQDMVDYAMTLADKEERQRCAESIVKIMERMGAQNRSNGDYKRKLWDHLAIMSRFKLDIDWPYDISEAEKISQKPKPVEYPASNIRVKHYGKLMFELFDKLKSMPAGDERDALVKYTANQMKRDLDQWSHGTVNEERVVSDLANFTDGKIQLDPATFKFEKTTASAQKQPMSNKRKRR